MIEVSNAVIQGIKQSEEEISFIFDKGQINYLPQEESYKFQLLKLKNQSLEKGSFVIDGTKIFPSENDDFSILYLTINSLVIIGLCFIIKKKNRKQFINEIQKSFSELKELPSESEEEKESKIAAIFSKIQTISPKYIVVDQKEATNRNNVYLQTQLGLIANDIVTVVLTYKEEVKEIPVVIQEEQEEISLDITIGEEEKVEPEQTKKTQEKTTNNKEITFGKTFIKTLKDNLMVFLSFLIPTIGVIAFTLLSPLYANTEQKILLLPFIITIVICFSLYLVMTIKCYDFNEGKPTREEKAIFFIINFITTVVGTGLGFSIYILFVLFDKTLNGSSNNVIGIIFASVLFILLVTLNLYVGPLFNKIKKLLKK